MSMRVNHALRCDLFKSWMLQGRMGIALHECMHFGNIEVSLPFHSLYSHFVQRAALGIQEICPRLSLAFVSFIPDP
jgi:hypothetical protein